MSKFWTKLLAAGAIAGAAAVAVTKTIKYLDEKKKEEDNFDICDEESTDECCQKQGSADEDCAREDGYSSDRNYVTIPYGQEDTPTQTESSADEDISEQEDTAPAENVSDTAQQE